LTQIHFYNINNDNGQLVEIKKLLSFSALKIIKSSALQPDCDKSE